MPRRPIPNSRKTKTVRTPLQRAANAQGLLNLNSAIEAELARLNTVKRLFNIGEQRENIRLEEIRARQAAADVLREIQEEEEAERLRLATPALPPQPLPVALPAALPVALPVPLPVALPPQPLTLAVPPPPVYLGPHRVLPFTNLELSDSPIVLTPYTGGKRSRGTRRKSKKSRKHLRR